MQLQKTFCLRIVFTIAFLAIFSFGNAQTPECACTSCDYVITPTSTDLYLQASEIKATLGVTDLSGKKICIKGGTTHTYSAISFIGIEGSLNNPIIITNCDGQAVINGGEDQPIRIWDSKYVKLLGNSCSGIKYGIHAMGDGNMVEIKAVNSRITDFEVAFINIGPNSGLGGSAGLKIMDEPGCDQDTLQPRSNSGRWIIRNINIHDNYIHNVATEGMYVGKGDEAYGGKPITCGGVTRTTSSASLQHVRIYNNLVDYVGWDGIQLKDADLDVKVYGNKITNYGVVRRLAQNEGLHLGSGVVGDVYENEINTGTGNGFQYMGAGNLNFYNNLIINSGEAGLWAFGKYFEHSDANSFIRIVNNTIVKTGTEPHDRKEAILWQNYGDVKNMILQNNIIAEVPGTREFIIADPGFDVVSYNDTVRDASTLNFDHYAEATAADFLEHNDFHLTSTSPSVDAGVNVSSYGTGYTKDFDGENRNFNNAYDRGAYEYQGIVDPDTTWAVYINAGGDDYVNGTTTWLRDKPANPHYSYNTAYTSFNTGSTSTFSGTNSTDAPTQILGSYRYTSGTNNRIIKYDIPVVQPGATYHVKLYFARRNTDAYGAGTRLFNILIEGATRYSGYDVYTNAATASDSLHYFVTVQDDTLNLSFEGIGTAHAQVNAISVVKYSQAPPPPGPEDFSYAINAGGESFVEDDLEWTRDKQLTPHEYYDTTFPSYNTGSFSTFSGTNDLEAPEQVLGSYRYTSGSTHRTLRYNIPVPEDGDYQVKLFFAKRNTDTYGSNVRRFDIKLENTTVHAAYDVADQVALGDLEEVFVTNVTDDFLEIKLVGVGSAHAQVNAIKIDGPISGTAFLAAEPVAEEVAAMEEKTGYAVYPNPIDQKVMVRFPKRGEYRVRILDAYNTTVFDQVYSSDTFEPKEINTSILPADGIYLLKIESGNKTHTFRLIKN